MEVIHAPLESCIDRRDLSQAPTAELRLLQAFVNSAGDAGDRRAIAVRDGLRALARANNVKTLSAAEIERVAALNAAAAELPVLVSVAHPNLWCLRPGARGREGFLAELIATLVESMADGTWSRMKVCRNDACRWLFYDHSRNRSGTWCSMALCGSRLKARAYRGRRRQNIGSVVRP